MKKLVLPIALVAISTLAAVAQQREVKGRIVDEGGEPLAGTSIIIKGTKTGVVTDDDGNFSITLTDPNAVLIVRSFGLGEKEVPLTANQGFVTVTLKGDSSKEVKGTVVTALGVRKEKKSLGYSVSEVDSDQIANSGERNALQSLAGKAPGLQVTSSSGTPGSSTKISLR